MVILGWEMTKIGEAWIVKNSWGPDSGDLRIGFRQYGIDSKVIAPRQSMLKFPWQNNVWKVHKWTVSWRTGDITNIAREDSVALLRSLGRGNVFDAKGKCIEIGNFDEPARSHGYRIQSIWAESDASYGAKVERDAQCFKPR